MESCPNIGGGEIRKRMFAGYLGLTRPIATIVFTIISDPGQLRLLVFCPSLLMGIGFFQVWDKTCIANTYFGIKNMGEKNHRERDADFLKIQRLQSVKIVVKAVLSAAILTAIIYSI